MKNPEPVPAGVVMATTERMAVDTIWGSVGVDVGGGVPDGIGVGVGSSGTGVGLGVGLAVVSSASARRAKTSSTLASTVASMFGSS